MPKLLAALALVLPLALALALHAEADVLRADLLQKAWQEGTVRVIVRLGARSPPKDTCGMTSRSSYSGETSLTSGRVSSPVSPAHGIG